MDLKRHIANYGITTSELVEELVIRSHQITAQDLKRLKNLLPEDPAEKRKNGLNADFNMLEEVRAQVELVQDMRESVYDKNGEITDIKEAKDVATAATQLLTTLNKMMSDIINRDYLKRIADAIVEAVSSLPEENQEKFFKHLEKVVPSR